MRDAPAGAGWELGAGREVIGGRMGGRGVTGAGRSITGTGRGRGRMITGGYSTNGGIVTSG